MHFLRSLAVLHTVAFLTALRAAPARGAVDLAKDCMVWFKGTQRNYDQCATNVGGRLAVYWTVSDDARSIDTLLVGTPGTGRYIAWAWNASEMVGATAAIANSDSDGNPAVAAYDLNGKRSSSVVRRDGFFSDAAVQMTAAGELRARFVQTLASPGRVDAIWAIGGRRSAAGRLPHHDSRGTLRLPVGRTDGATGSGASPTPSPAPCVGVAHLAQLRAADLVFKTHRAADVLCDERDSCATHGHVVTFRGAPMTMRTYCAAHARCVRRRVLVNSPRMRRGVRVASNTTDLMFTALSARYGSWFEESLLGALVHVGV